MRNLTLAALALALAASGAASAQTGARWTDPSGKVSFDPPAGWPVDVVSNAGASPVYVISGNADIECQFIGLESAASAGRSVDVVRSAYANPLPPEAWTAMSSGMRMFRSGVEVTSQSVDTSGFWPIQRAVLRSGESTIHAGMQGRPGYEIRTFCLTYDGSDGAATFERVIRSVGTPQDQALQAQAAPAPAATPAPPAE
ncbi:MAG: hypothetical protein GC189_04220 [Alphaproteobacteria bacterium]|nr:hypothetical protein [Alphaproteobacteria bacterium]